jgi:hypothetical protein
VCTQAEEEIRSMKLIQSALETIKESRRAYIILNLVYYGLVVFGMVYVAFNPSLQQLLIDAVGNAFTEGVLSAVGSAYTGGQVLQAMVLTFVVNLFLGSIAVITVPSLVIPFSGLLIGAYRALLWGLLLSPTTPVLRWVMIPHSLVLILEGQAYILAMLAAYVQGRAFLWPHSVGAATRRQGYGVGVKLSVRIYLLIVLLLALAAVYEALEVVFVLRLVGSL